jgi:hypothetical protein
MCFLCSLCWGVINRTGLEFCKEGFVVRKLQHSLSSMETWCECWNIKINEDKTRGIYFSRSRRPPESHLILNGRDIPFVNSETYLGVIFDKKVTGRLHIEMIEAKAFRTFIRIYSLFKSEWLNTPTLNWPSTKHSLGVSWLMLAPPGSLQQTTNYWYSSARKTKFSAPLEIFQGALRFVMCIWLSNFRI